MAQRSNTGLIVGVLSVMVIGTTIFLIVRKIKKDKQNQQLPPLMPQQPQNQQGQQSQQTQTQTQTQTTPTNRLGGFVDALSDLFKGRATENKSDKFTDFKFPIRKGQKGDNVKKLQQLILGINNKALPKFGADGDFGNETASAISRLIGKESIDNQADLDRLKKVGYDTASKIALNMASGFRLF